MEVIATVEMISLTSNKNETLMGSFIKRLDKRVRKNPQHSVTRVTVRIPITQFAPVGFRQVDKARETLDPHSQKHLK